MLGKFSKLTAATMAAALTVTLISGCSGNDAQPNASSGSSVPERNEPIEITWGVHFQAPGVINDTKVEQWLEEKFNVEIKPVKVTDVSIASGEVPDVFTLGDASGVSAYRSQGVLMELDRNALEQQLPEYSNGIRQSNATSLFETVTFDGKLYALPMFVDLKPYDFVLAWRQDWLDNVGIAKIPETLDEFEQAVYAFARQDPDSDGQPNTYGLTGTATQSWATGFFSLFGAFGVEPTQWRLRDGKIANDTVSPGAKEALAKLRQWYADGVLDPEFITDTQDNYRKKLYNNRIGVIEDSISRIALEDGSTVAEMKAANPSAVLAIGRNPEGPGGAGSWDWGVKSNFVVFGSHLKDDPAKLAKVMEIVRAQSSDEETINMTSLGERGKTWDFVESGATSGPTKFLPGFEKPEQRDVEGVRLFSLGNITSREYRNAYMNPKMVEAVGAYSSAPNWTDALLFSALPSDGKYKQELLLLTQKAYAQIITGERPLEHFDAFVDEWMAKGGETLTKEANELYAAQFQH